MIATARPPEGGDRVPLGGDGQDGADAAVATLPLLDTPPGSRLATALAALDASRAQLRHQMMPPPEPPSPAWGGSSGGPGALGRGWRALRRGLRDVPLAGLAVQAVQAWWLHHPWRPVGELVANELRGTVQPALRRHPVLAVVGAAGLGAALLAGRPWRWPLVSAQLRPLPGRVVHWLTGQLGQPSVQAALAGLLWMLTQQATERAAAAAAAPPSPHDPTSAPPDGATPHPGRPASTAAGAAP